MNFPAGCFQTLLIPQVILYIFLELFLPKFDVRFRRGTIITALMPMPIAAVYKNNGSIFGQYDIRFSRHGCDVFPKAEPLRKKIPTYHDFDFCIFSANAGHIPASTLSVQPVHYSSPFSLVTVFTLNLLPLHGGCEQPASSVDLVIDGCLANLRTNPECVAKTAAAIRLPGIFHWGEQPPQTETHSDWGLHRCLAFNSPPTVPNRNSHRLGCG